MATGALSLFSFFYALVVLVLIDLDYTFASAYSPFFECQVVIALDIAWLLIAFPGAGSLLIKSNIDSSFILGSTSLLKLGTPVCLGIVIFGLLNKAGGENDSGCMPILSVFLLLVMLSDSPTGT